MRLSRFFIDRPIFAAVLSIVIFIAGLIAMVSLPISEYPEVVPPSIVVRAVYPGANPARPERDRGDAARGADQRRREHAVHVVPGHLGRRAHAHRHLPGRHRRRPGPGAGAEPREPGPAPAARGSPPARRHDREELAQPHHGGAPGLAGRAVRRHLPPQLRAAPGQGRPRPDPGRGPGPGLRRRRLRDAGLARSGQGGGPRPHRERRRERHPRAERAGGGRRGGRRPRCRCPWTTSSP